MGQTPRLALPYPELDDPADVPTDMGELATRLDGIAATDDQGTLAARPAAGTRGRYYFATDEVALYRDSGSAWLRVGGPALVTSLPATPSDGQEVYYVADAASGIVWHLRYRAAALGTYKWEYVGGSDLRAYYAPACSISGTANYPTWRPADPMGGETSAALELQLPALAGDWSIECGAMYNSDQSVAGTWGGMSYTVGSTAAGDGWAAFAAGTAQQRQSPFNRYRHNGVASGVKLVAQHTRQAGNHIPYWSYRYLHARPIRVG